VRRVRVSCTGAHWPHPDERDRRITRRGCRETASRGRRRRGGGSRNRPGRSRIRLSAKAALVAHEAEEVREVTAREKTGPGDGFGSLADKLRSALKPRGQ